MIDKTTIAWGLLALHTFWMWKTDYRNGEKDPWGPFPRGGPHYKPRELVEKTRREREALQKQAA